MDWQQILGVIFGALIIYLALAIRYVDRPFHWVVETNFPGGMHPYEWKPGLRLLWLPIAPLMFVKNKVNMAQKPVVLHIGMADGVGRKDAIDFVDTKAGALVQVIYIVQDPLLATYNVQEEDFDVKSHDEAGQEITEHYKGYERATLNRVEAELRSFFGKYKFDEANEDSERDQIEEKVLNKIKPYILQHWGVEVLLIDIIDFSLDEKTATARGERLLATVTADVMKTTAQAESDAMVMRAQGQKESTIRIAQGNQEAAELDGIGEQKRLKALHVAGLDSVQAAAYTVAREANQAIAKGNATIIATSEGGNMNLAATLAGIAKGMNLGGGNQNASPTPAPSAPTPPAQTPAPHTPQSTRRRGNNP